MVPALQRNLHRSRFLLAAGLGATLPGAAGAQERFDKTELVEAASRRRADAEPHPPDEIEIEDGQPTAPPGYHLEHRARTGRAGVGGVNGLVPRDLYVRNGLAERPRPTIAVATAPAPGGGVVSLSGTF